MTFHLEYCDKNTHRREGAHSSRGEAVLAALSVKSAPVLIIDGVREELVAVVLKRGEVVSVGMQPAWWDDVSDTAKTALVGGGQLSADTVEAVTRAGGSVVASSWSGGSVDEWHLALVSRPG
ncbi:hypothetical protein ACI3KT_11630 [Microbacterium sp. ZW T6_19]|uniref:hypothetical protein n=1 Tax=Microbacterium sp. ZW T6_19 TaxID=3378082 RepID=UPI00385522C5